MENTTIIVAICLVCLSVYLINVTSQDKSKPGKEQWTTT